MQVRDLLALTPTDNFVIPIDQTEKPRDEPLLRDDVESLQHWIDLNA